MHKHLSHLKAWLAAIVDIAFFMSSMYLDVPESLGAALIKILGTNSQGEGSVACTWRLRHTSFRRRELRNYYIIIQKASHTDLNQDSQC